MNDRPVFVVGVGRSGTTLLRLMLTNHPRLAIPYESHFMDRYYQRSSEFGDLTDERRFRQLAQAIVDEPMVKMWDHSFDLDRLVGRVRERTLPGLLRALYEDYAAGKGKPRWGDKSDYLDRMPVIKEMFPDAQFIHIIRDGRDVANSVMKLPWGPKDIVRAAEWWHDHVWLGCRIGQVLGKENYTEVRYEHLVERPEEELRRLCAFIGEEYSAQMLDYPKAADQAIPDARKFQHQNSNRPPNGSRLYAWKREMHPCDVELFDRHAKKMLKELGYEIPEIRASRVRLGWHLMKAMTSRYRHARRRAAQQAPTAQNSQH